MPVEHVAEDYPAFSQEDCHVLRLSELPLRSKHSSKGISVE